MLDYLLGVLASSLWGQNHHFLIIFLWSFIYNAIWHQYNLFCYFSMDFEAVARQQHYVFFLICFLRVWCILRI